MKYWMFQSNQVVGPFDREELAEQGGFSAESLVCPEGRKGTQMGDWQRAGVVAELAEVLLRKAKVPVGATGSPALDPGASLIPPEPTLRDLAVLGTLQEKVSLLENSLSQMQDELRQREEEITGLKVQLDEKSQEAGQLEKKLTGLESKLDAAEGGLKDELGKTKDEVAHENELIEGLKGQLDSVRSDIQQSLSKLEENQGKLRDELKGQVGELKRKGGAVPALVPENDAPPAAAPDLTPQSAGADLDLPEAGAPGGLPALEGTGELGELPPPPGLAGSFEEVPPPGLLDPTPGDELPPPPADLPAPGGDLPPPPGTEMPGAEGFNLDAPPALDPGDPPAVTLDPPPALSAESEGGLPAMDLEAPPGLEPLDAPAPGEAFELPITQTGAAASEPLVPPPSMPAPVPGGAGEEADLVDLSVSAAPEAGPKKKKGGLLRKLMIAGLLLVLVAGALAQGYRMGVLKPYLDPILKPIKPMLRPHLRALGLLPKKSPPAATLKEPDAFAPAPPPQAGAVAPPTAEEMRDRTQEAIEFAKNWPVGTDGKTLAMMLRSDARSGRRLEPWNAERLSEGRFQVNFYANPGSTPDYQFEVLLDAGQIRGLTAKSGQALKGKLPVKTPPPAARRTAPKRSAARRRRPSGASRRKGRTAPRKELNEDGSLTDPLGQMLLDSSLGERAPVEKAAPEPAAPAPAAPKKSSRKRSAREKAPEPAVEEADPFTAEDDTDGKSSEELTLDELLLPGVPAR